MQEVIKKGKKDFLIVGIGINLVSNPKISSTLKSTDIFLETKRKPNITKMIDLIIKSYESFFYNLNMYNFIKFKKKAELMSLK